MPISKEFLSGGANGINIPVVAVATPGTLIHTAHATNKDEIFIFATNTDTTDRKLTIEWGGVTAPGDLTEVTIPAEDGEHLVVAGRLLSNSLIVRAFAEIASVINIGGYINRHS